MTDSIMLADTHTTMAGPGAVEIFRLAALASALKFEIRCPGMKLTRGPSALAIAKLSTGLRTNDRAAQLARVERMLEEARAKVPVIDNRTQPQE